MIVSFACRGDIGRILELTETSNYEWSEVARSKSPKPYDVDDSSNNEQCCRNDCRYELRCVLVERVGKTIASIEHGVVGVVVLQMRSLVGFPWALEVFKFDCWRIADTGTGKKRTI